MARQLLAGRRPSSCNQRFQDDAVLGGHLRGNVSLGSGIIEGRRVVGGRMLPEEVLDVAVAGLGNEICVQ